MSRKTIRADVVHKRWMKNPRYRATYDALAGEFAWSAALIEARAQAGLTQEEIAQRMGTTQQVISRLESGRTNPLDSYIGALCGGDRNTANDWVCAGQ